MPEKKISIVMAYWNRKPQLLFTLKTISLSAYKNIEVIIVDDASDDQHRLEDIVNNYQFKIHLIRINKEEKTWINPCIAYNKGFARATGEIVIVQNPECCHVGDCLTYVSQHLKPNDYLTFSCFALNNMGKNDYLQKIYTEDKDPSPVFKFIEDVSKEKWCINHGWKGWYNHPVHNPRKFHFMSATMKSNIEKMGGFDENYAMGLWFDDNEFFLRISALCQATILPLSEKVCCIHQYHDHSKADDHLALKNKSLYMELLGKIERKEDFIDWRGHKVVGGQRPKGL